MDKSIERKVFDLTNAICEKTAQENDISELNEILREYPQSRKIYLSIMDLHFDLDRMSLTGALAPSQDSCEPVLRKLDRIEQSPKTSKRFPLFIAAAALIAVCFSLFLTTNIMNQNKYEAIVIESQDETWTIGSTFKINDSLTLSEDEKIKLQFGDKTLIELTGPISTSLEQSDSKGRKFKVNSNDQTDDKTILVDSGETLISVNSGQLSENARFKVIENKNSFGIQFKNKLTEVHVFKGLVTSKGGVSENIASETQKIHNLQAAGFNQNGLLIKWTKPDYKAFDIPKNISGVVSTNKYVHWMSSKPASLQQGKLESNESIFLIQEKKNVILPHEIPVTFSDRLRSGNGGTQSAYDTHIRMLPKGTKVDSYLLHYDPAAKKYLDGDIHFERKIVAIIARGNQLDHSDQFFALDGVEYPQHNSPYRGLDGNRKDEEVDVLKYKKNPYEIGIRFNIETDTIDQIRILVESE